MPKLSFFLLIMSILFTMIWVNGCVHSIKKHPEDGFLKRYTPAAAYRGVEYFWHQQFVGVNWEERMDEDILKLYSFMDAYAASKNKDSLRIVLEGFSEELSIYPPEKLAMLTKWGQALIIMVEKMQEEVDGYLTSKLFNAGEDSRLSFEPPKMYLDSAFAPQLCQLLTPKIAAIDSFILAEKEKYHTRQLTDAQRNHFMYNYISDFERSKQSLEVAHAILF